MALFTPVVCDLSIIIVSWNVWPLLEGCLRSIERSSRLAAGSAAMGIQLRSFGPADAAATLEVIVVDNAGSDETVERLPRLFPWVHLIACDTNLGFTRGNNHGYAASHGRYVYFLNPDTELAGELSGKLFGGQPQHDSLSILYAVIDAAPDIAVVGPQLRYGDSTFQPSARRFPTPATGFFESTWLGWLWPANPWSQRLHMRDWPVSYSHDVDWLVGAAMLCRREALEEVRTLQGPFDERFFMYSEEVDLCRRLKSHAWRIVYVPAALVIHYEGKSSEQASAARHIHFNTSKVLYYTKWFAGLWPALLRSFLLLEFRIQLWIEQGKLLLGHKPALRRQRIDTYRQVLRSRLRPQPEGRTQPNP